VAKPRPRRSSGVWKDLTDNVNQLAANLTNQVRAIAEVATAVTDGDLTRQVQVEASGEVAILKDKLNEMIRNLRETTRQNVEQDWLKTNRERFTRMLQGQRDLATVSRHDPLRAGPARAAQHGVFYSMTSPLDGSDPVLELQAGYGYEERRHLSTVFHSARAWSASAPRRRSGSCSPRSRRLRADQLGPRGIPALNIIVLPVLFEGSVRAVIELASFSLSVIHQTFLDQLMESIGIVLNTIEANRSPRTCSSRPRRRPKSSAPSRTSCANPTRTSSAAKRFWPSRTSRRSRRSERSSSPSC
jgi:HAMP domain-containing protein